MAQDMQSGLYPQQDAYALQRQQITMIPRVLDEIERRYQMTPDEFTLEDINHLDQLSMQVRGKRFAGAKGGDPHGMLGKSFANTMSMGALNAFGVTDTTAKTPDEQRAKTTGMIAGLLTPAIGIGLLSRIPRVGPAIGRALKASHRTIPRAAATEGAIGALYGGMLDQEHGEGFSTQGALGGAAGGAVIGGGIGLLGKSKALSGGLKSLFRMGDDAVPAAARAADEAVEAAADAAPQVARQSSRSAGTMSALEKNKTALFDVVASDARVIEMAGSAEGARRVAGIMSRSMKNKAEGNAILNYVRRGGDDELRAVINDVMGETTYGATTFSRGSTHGGTKLSNAGNFRDNHLGRMLDSQKARARAAADAKKAAKQTATKAQREASSASWKEAIVTGVGHKSESAAASSLKSMVDELEETIIRNAKDGKQLEQFRTMALDKLSKMKTVSQKRAYVQKLLREARRKRSQTAATTAPKAPTPDSPVGTRFTEDGVEVDESLGLGVD